MSAGDQFDIALMHDGDRQFVTVRAGRRGVRRVVPPAGEDYAFDVQEWAREVHVYVSPTGRSVRVFVDGVEVAREAPERPSGPLGEGRTP